jgi:hypothetical protein
LNSRQRGLLPLQGGIQPDCWFLDTTNLPLKQASTGVRKLTPD